MVLPLLAKLQDSKTDWTILTEVAYPLSKIPDNRSIQPLYDLNKKLQAIHDPDNADQCTDSNPRRDRSSGRNPVQ